MTGRTEAAAADEGYEDRPCPECFMPPEDAYDNYLYERYESAADAAALHDATGDGSHPSG